MVNQIDDGVIGGVGEKQVTYLRWKTVIRCPRKVYKRLPSGRSKPIPPLSKTTPNTRPRMNPTEGTAPTKSFMHKWISFQMGTGVLETEIANRRSHPKA